MVLLREQTHETGQAPETQDLSSAESQRSVALVQGMRNLGRQDKCKWKQARQAAYGTVGPPAPRIECSLTLLSSGVGGRGFFDAEMRKTAKENEPETERPQQEVGEQSGGFLAEEKGPEGDSETQSNEYWPCQNLCCSFQLAGSPFHFLGDTRNFQKPIF